MPPAPFDRNLPFDRSLVERVIAAAADRLEGDWLLVGGALAVMWLDSERATEDIDLFSLRGLPADRDLFEQLKQAIELSRQQRVVGLVE